MISSAYCFEAQWSVTESGFKNEYLHLRNIDQTHQKTPDQCKPIEIDNSWSVAVECLRFYPHIQLDLDNKKSRLIQMNLELWLPKGMRDYEIEIHNANGSDKYPETVSIPNTLGLPRGKWSTLSLFISHLQKQPNTEVNAHINFHLGKNTFTRKRQISKSKSNHEDVFKNIDETVKLFYGLKDLNKYIYDLKGAYIRAIKVIEIEPEFTEQTDQTLARWIKEDTNSLLNHQGLLKLIFMLFFMVSMYLIISSPVKISSQLWLVILPLIFGLFFFSPKIVFELGESLDLLLQQRINRALNASYEKILNLHKQAQREGIIEIDREIRKLEFNSIKDLDLPFELGSIQWLKYVDNVFKLKNEAEILKLYNKISDIQRKLLFKYKDSSHPFWKSKIKNHQNNYQKLADFKSLEKKFITKDRIKKWIYSVHPLCLELERLSYEYETSVYLISPSRFFEWSQYGLGNGSTIRQDFRLISRRLAAELNLGNESLEDEQFRELRTIMKNYGGDSIDLQAVLEEPLTPTTFLHSNVSQTYEDFIWTWNTFDDENFVVSILLQHRFVASRTYQLIKSQLKKELKSLGIEFVLKRRDWRPDYPKTLYNQKHLMRFAAKVHQLEQEGTETAIENNHKHLMIGRNIPIARTFLCLDMNLELWFKKHRNQKKFIFWMIIIGTILIFIIIHYLTNGLLKPLKQVDQKLNQVIEGNFDVAIPKYVARDLNKLSLDLEYLIKQLRETEELTGFLSGSAAENIRDLRPTQIEDVCVLFCGIFGMEELDVSEQMSALSEFLNEIQSILDEQGAMIDKFTGAACLAIFQHQHIIDAPLKASQAIINWKKRNNFELDICVGLASGKAMLGHVGSQQRKDYTCIGDTVNLAARLETLSKSRGLPMNRIYLDKSTYLKHQNSEWEFTILEPISIKGKSGFQEVYALQT